MTIIIHDDLTATIVTDDGLLECNLPNYNPETLVPFASKAEVEAFANTVTANPNYFVLHLSDEKKQAARDRAASLENSTRAKAELLATDWVEYLSVRDTSVIPHLINIDEFDQYRIALRLIAVTDPVVVENWPEAPAKLWKVEE